MKRKAPFAKKPSSQYQKPDFYWRGGDAYREQEYLADEFKKALADKRKAELEYQKVKDDLKEIEETANNRQAYTDALASNLDSEVSSPEIKAYKDQLRDLENKIKDKEMELQEAQSLHHPAVRSSLLKEKAFLLLEMQGIQESISLLNTRIETDKKRLAEISTMKKYQTALNMETKATELVRKKKYLRNLVNSSKAAFESCPKVITVPGNTAQKERDMCDREIDLNLQGSRADEKKSRRQPRWDYRIQKLIDEIQFMNDRLADLGFTDDELVDVDSIRSKYQPKSNNEEDSPEEDENEGTENNADDQPIEKDE